MLQHIEIVLQCVAVCDSFLFLPVSSDPFLMLQCVVVCCSVLQHATEVLQCVAVCYSVLQCVTACCSVVQCVVVEGWATPFSSMSSKGKGSSSPDVRFMVSHTATLKHAARHCKTLQDTVAVVKGKGIEHA